ncbi:hypothetical protein DEI81_06060 [Curtobacterium sp. MCBD17_013]|uniref:hypothetical protein n=1 Tax=unclassified Curtobacterium TaxID=257496 RepID=UPI000DA7802C|nr:MULTISPECIES: hypothetical protein [unclassified Curtobacterium]PZF64499.1 hypothetical protein DEI81_06060 [Curtobacterium sp. MCBD17_013]WIB66331.1 hypothetical protein DEI93_10075 [Curtobacterium sp. MCBD17_035]
MSAVPSDDTSSSAVPDTTGVTLGKVVVWVVAAVLFAYVLWQAIGNFVGVTTTLSANNAFLRRNGGDALQTSVPWVALVIDVAIAPVLYAVAWFVARRTDLVRTVVVFLAAFCAVAALWFDVLQYVSATLRVGG